MQHFTFWKIKQKEGWQKLLHLTSEDQQRLQGGRLGIQSLFCCTKANRKEGAVGWVWLQKSCSLQFRKPVLFMNDKRSVWPSRKKRDRLKKMKNQFFRLEGLKECFMFKSMKLTCVSQLQKKKRAPKWKMCKNCHYFLYKFNNFKIKSHLWELELNKRNKVDHLTV